MRDRTKAQAAAKALVAQMTIEERASQLKYDAPAIDRLGIPAYNWWNEALHGVARAGTATMFPQPVAMASMFDEDIMKKIGDAVSVGDTVIELLYNDDTKLAEAMKYLTDCWNVSEKAERRELILDYVF